jgi:DNA-binding transcriptional regulator YhcF (GntR family)
MRIVFLALLVYSTAVFAAKCDSYGQKVASNLRTFFTDDENLSGVEQAVKYPEDAKVPSQETRATHESVPPKTYQKSYQKLDPALRGFFQRVSRRAHDIEQELKLEEELLQKELECEAELAKLKRQREISNNVASVRAKFLMKDFQSLLEIQKKNPYIEKSPITYTKK